MKHALIDYLRSTLMIWEEGCFRMYHTDEDQIITISEEPYAGSRVRVTVGVFYNIWFNL